MGMQIRLWFCISFLMFANLGVAQKHTVSGYVRDSASVESLIGATVTLYGTQLGTVSNTQGFYSLTLPGDTLLIEARFVGYKRKVVSLVLLRDTIINFKLKSGQLLEEVTVKSTGVNAETRSNLNSHLLKTDQLKLLPTLLGEADILRTIQLLPGIKGSEGSTSLYVRGGGADQNLMLLDGVPVYNASHLFGFFSVFNADAINHTELFKGGFPARFGGRLSSVIDIHMKDGNMNKHMAETAIGTISSKVTVEGPVKQDKSSFIFSARRTYIDLLAAPFINKNTDVRTGYYFYDLNFKFNQIIDHKNRLYFSNYYSSDLAYGKSKDLFGGQDASDAINQQYKLGWNNTISALRWNHIFDPKLFGNIAASFSKYRFEILQEYGAETSFSNVSSSDYISSIRDWSLKLDFDYLPHPDHFVRFGVNQTWHRFVPGTVKNISATLGESLTGSAILQAGEGYAYIEDAWRMSSKLSVNVGAHLSAFRVGNKTYYSMQPRVSGSVQLPRNYAVKSSFTTMTQYIHLLTNSGVGLPTDLWVPSTARIPPQQSWQVTTGIVKSIDTRYEISLEGYVKQMHHLIEYLDGENYLNVVDQWEDKVASDGRGTSRGLEFLAQKRTGKTTGWLGYTLSKTSRQFADLNLGRAFPYKYDRRHDISLSVNHSFAKTKSLSLVWVYASGNAVTLPVATQQTLTNNFDSRYTFDGYGTYYGERNSNRMNAYHRLDLIFSWSKEKKWGERKWNVGLYNAYNHLNPFYIEVGRDDQQNIKYIQYTLFPILPSISYIAKFYSR